MKSSPQKILVVDDEKNIVRLTQMNLERIGYQVITATDGLEAMKAVERECPDLIVMDITMPHMDGMEVLRTLKSDPLFRPIPIILYSVKAQDEAINHAALLGADLFLNKPVEPLELVRCIEGFLGPRD